MPATPRKKTASLIPRADGERKDTKKDMPEGREMHKEDKGQTEVKDARETLWPTERR